MYCGSSTDSPLINRIFSQATEPISSIQLPLTPPALLVLGNPAVLELSKSVQYVLCFSQTQFRRLVHIRRKRYTVKINGGPMKKKDDRPWTTMEMIAYGGIGVFLTLVFLEICLG